jgi:hypothetical protein
MNGTRRGRKPPHLESSEMAESRLIIGVTNRSPELYLTFGGIRRGCVHPRMYETDMACGDSVAQRGPGSCSEQLSTGGDTAVLLQRPLDR